MVLQAPSLVIAKAVEMLIGDMKMLLASDLLLASSWKREKANLLFAFDSSHTRGLVFSGTFSVASVGSSVSSSVSGLR